MTYTSNSTFNNSSFAEESVVPCYQLQILGVYCVALMVSSMFFSGLMIFIYIRNKDLQIPFNTLIISISCLNFVAALIDFPFIIASNFSCRWTTGRVGCIVSAFFMYFTSCASVYILMAISFERFFMVYKPMNARAISQKLLLGVIAACCFGGFLWALFPILGWSEYALEGALTSCSINWADRNSGVFSYVICIFIFVFAVPFSVIAGTNLKLVLLVRNMPRIFSEGPNSAAAAKRLNRERYFVRLSITLTVLFVLSWLPYALVSFGVAFFNADVPPLVGTLPALVAKASTLWTSVYYLFSNRQFRRKIKTIMPGFFGIEMSPRAARGSVSRQEEH